MFSEKNLATFKRILEEVLDKKLNSVFDHSTFHQKLTNIENNLKQIIQITSDNLESLRRINSQLDKQTERLNSIRSHIGLATTQI
ncbi:MAG: hypothetical protein UX37_C0017G0002 [Microgenomates group bacterium GW2011_GWA2_46_16]|nr:MAG: hypothetical protein UX37_C0017G0002 [Microgenomates group bacterium GW2011_GWA2_46_16]